MVSQQIRAAVLAELPDLLRSLGGDPTRLLATVGLTADDLADPDSTIPALAARRCFTLGAEATGHDHFGALVAQRHDLHTYLGTLGRVVWAAPDLGTALARFTERITSHVEGSRWTLHVDNEVVYLCNETEGGGPTIHAAGHNLTLLHRLMRAITANRWHPSLVFFACSEPSDPAFFRQTFDCPVLYDQPINALVFHSTDLRLNVPTADDQLSEILLRHEDIAPNSSQTSHTAASGLVQDVERLIEKNLLAGITSIDAVAKFLPYSRSTLQQRLTNLGTSHQKILDHIRDRRARHQLTNSNTTITEIARTLSYSSADTFAVAFKRRHGTSPKNWRATHSI